MTFVPNQAGIEEILRSAGVRRAVQEACEAVADAVDAQGLVAESGSSESGPQIVGATEVLLTGDGLLGLVTIEHPAGLAMQAKHGVLTRAASAAGLEVRGRS